MNKIHTKAKRSQRKINPLFFAAFLFLCFSIVLFSSPSLAGDDKRSPESFKKGKELFERGKYDEAIESFKAASDEIPVIRDYTLFFMAKAYNREERFEDSDKTLQELLQTYPDSPLKKRARALRIYNIIGLAESTPLNRALPGSSDRNPLSEQKGSTSIPYLESYAADYPEDAEISFFLAGLLKISGKADQAKKMFIAIYTGNNRYSEQAYKELHPSDITADHMLEKASNYIKKSEYQKAETILRKILSDGASKTASLPAGPAYRTGGQAGPVLRDEIYKKLGLALFRQKKYKEASEAYLKTGDLYNGARSLYRGGEIDAFNEIVSKLVSMEDRRAATLLMAYASKKRREGRGEEAITIFNDVLKRYPYYSEEALWGIAWTHYRGKDYKKAGEILTALNDKYPGSKYAYWKNRCIEKDKDEPDHNPREGRKKIALQTDFYALLEEIGDKGELKSGIVRRDASSVGSEREPQTGARSRPGRIPPDVIPSLERFALLLELGMKEDAVSELVRVSNTVSKPEALIPLCLALQEVGAYKRSIALLSRFPEQRAAEEDYAYVFDILYPLAYWPTVREAAQRYRLDPLILLSVIREESRFDPRARSVAGALGLMQIMPHTARSLDKALKIEISDDNEIYNIRTNITIGAYYLSSLLKEFGSLPAALAAYNAGDDRVREWLKKGNYASQDEFIEDIPFDETRNYVKRVLLTYYAYLNPDDGQSKENGKDHGKDSF